jgi:hypothetical protein
VCVCLLNEHVWTYHYTRSFPNFWWNCYERNCGNNWYYLYYTSSFPCASAKRHEEMWDRGGKAQNFLNISASSRWIVNFTLQLLQSRRKSLWYTQARRLGVLQTQPGPGGEEKKRRTATSYGFWCYVQSIVSESLRRIERILGAEVGAGKFLVFSCIQTNGFI